MTTIDSKIEIWKDIEGYEGLYQVSTLGRVRSLDRVVNYINNSVRHIKGRVIKTETAYNGYTLVFLHKGGKVKGFNMHRLVALTFIPNPDNLPQVNHKDENPTNNCVDNLEWCTAQYNANYGSHIDKVRKALTGRAISDEQKALLSKINTGKKLSEETKNKIRKANIAMGKWKGDDNPSRKNPQTGERNGMFGKQHTDEFKELMHNLYAGTRYINNGKINKRVHPDELEYYTSNGWELGMCKKED